MWNISESFLSMNLHRGSFTKPQWTRMFFSPTSAFCIDNTCSLSVAHTDYEAPKLWSDVFMSAKSW